jgi:thiol:disulfide interchange protein DsbD
MVHDRTMNAFPLRVVLISLAAIVAVRLAATAGGDPAHVPGDDAVTARLRFDDARIHAGGTGAATIALTPAPGWHLYGPEHADAGAPPEVAWSLPRGVHARPIAFPPARRVVAHGLTTFEYDKRVLLRIPLTVAADIPPLRRARVVAHVAWLVCAHVCAPGGATLTGVLDITPRTR